MIFEEAKLIGVKGGGKGCKKPRNSAETVRSSGTRDADEGKCTRGANTRIDSHKEIFNAEKRRTRDVGQRVRWQNTLT